MLPPTHDAEAALKFVPRIARWFTGLWTAPRKMRELEERVAEATDHRIHCLECRDGRLVGFGTRTGRAGWVGTVGQCNVCGTWFTVDPRARTIIGVSSGPPGHA